MNACPRCAAQGSLEQSGDAQVCSRCGFRSDGAEFAQHDEIPTWKPLVAALVPALFLWIAAANNNKKVETPIGMFTFGLAFFSFGVWSAGCGVVWDRLSAGFKRWWRPPYALTPWILAVAFCGGGGLYIVKGLVAWTE